jgi:cytochrome P450
MDNRHHITRSNVLEPGPWYQTIRTDCPVHRDTGYDPPFFVLSKYHDIDRAVRETDLWVNHDGPGLAFAGQGVLQTADGDDHRRHRATVTQAFTSPAMRRLAPRVTQIVKDLFDRFAAAGEGDWVGLLAKPYPAIVIAEILGVPADSRDDFAAASAEMVAAFGDGDAQRYARASADLRGQIEVVAKARLGALSGWDPASGADPEPGLVPDDVSTMLAVAHRRGDLDYQEMIGIGTNLLVGGHETTTNLLALMLYRLAEQPGLLEKVRSDRSLVETTVEESLRFDSPTQGMFRTNTRDTEVGGVAIPQGSKVQLLYASANRDEDVWDDPEEFRLDRDPRDLRRHMAFGRGIHLCIGAPLARMEAAAALTEVLDRFATVELAATPELTPPFILRGFTTMPIRWTLV